MVDSFVLPTLEKQAMIFDGLQKAAVSDALLKAHGPRRKEFESTFIEVLNSLVEFKEKVGKCRAMNGEEARMKEIVTVLQPSMEKLRKACDHAETLVADDLWPLPKYREMLFMNSLS